jgi:very-short-patch-repair endonuclease
MGYRRHRKKFPKHKKDMKPKDPFGSPIERKFFKMAESLGLTLIPQHKEARYKLDFLYVEGDIRFAIELDGSRYHSSRAQMTHDYRRQRYLQSLGYIVIRFTGKEIKEDVAKCVNDFIELKDVLIKYATNGYKLLS